MKTIKTLTLFISILLSTNIVFGQFKVGGTIGLGASTQSELGNIYNNDDLYFSYNVGLIIKNQFNNWFALKSNILYSTKGRQLNYANNLNKKQTDEFNYLIVPLKAEYSTPINKQNLILAAGPYAGFLISSNKEIDNTSTDIMDQVEKLDFGISMEIGIIQPLSKFDVQFSLNYDMGLSQITKYDNDLRNKSLTFNVGFIF